MYDYIKGNISEISPTEVIVECCGIGYSIMISLQTYDILKDCSEAKIFIYHYIREDDEQFYGFATKDERELFKLLIAKIKSIKGIGLKTAQRLILDLKDKIIKGGGVDKANLTIPDSNNNIDEATTALLNLGFTKANISKILPTILKSEPQASIETIIREALKRL